MTVRCIRCLAVLIGTALALPSAEAGHTLQGPFDDGPATYSLVPNGGMEVAVNGTELVDWTVYNTDHTVYGRDNGFSYAGSSSGALIDPSYSSTGAGISLGQDIAVTNGVEYVLSAYVFNGIVGGGLAYVDEGCAGDDDDAGGPTGGDDDDAAGDDDTFEENVDPGSFGVCECSTAGRGAGVPLAFGLGLAALLAARRRR